MNGHKLHPEAEAYLRWLVGSGVRPASELPIGDAREQTERQARFFGGLVDKSVAIEDRWLPGPKGKIPWRLYRPRARRESLPLLVFLHGGGWVVGSINSHDHVCRALARGANMLVASVGYRLSPEHPYPEPLDDAWEAFRHLEKQREGLGATQTLVGGDSAGANLAACVAIRAARQGSPAVDGQLLLYPVTDIDFERPSYKMFAEGFGLTTQTMKWYWSRYLAHSSEVPPDAVPMLAPTLEGVPAAVVMTAEFDPLRDEGEEYARRLADVGVSVQLFREEGLVHGFAWTSALVPTGTLALVKGAQRLIELSRSGSVVSRRDNPVA